MYEHRFMEKLRSYKKLLANATSNNNTRQFLKHQCSQLLSTLLKTVQYHLSNM